MSQNLKVVLYPLLVLFLSTLGLGCVPPNFNQGYAYPTATSTTPPPPSISLPDGRLDRRVEYYQEAGRTWGIRLFTIPGGPWKPKVFQVDRDFIHFLGSPPKELPFIQYRDYLHLYIDYFNTNTELKDAFNRGFYLGYPDRIADLVLGEHKVACAFELGKTNADNFVKIIEQFQKSWVLEIQRTVDLFTIMVSEGSKEDLDVYVKNFTTCYKASFENNEKLLKSSLFLDHTSQGGTKLLVNYEKGRALGAANVPEVERLKAEIYHQAFRVMGNETGRKYSTNLIKRDVLIELLRRSKTALAEGGRYDWNLTTMFSAFCEGYGTDAENIFFSLLKAADLRVPSTEKCTDARKIAAY